MNDGDGCAPRGRANLDFLVGFVTENQPSKPKSKIVGS